MVVLWVTMFKKLLFEITFDNLRHVLMILLYWYQSSNILLVSVGELMNSQAIKRKYMYAGLSVFP